MSDCILNVNNILLLRRESGAGRRTGTGWEKEEEEEE